jgi:hypothetical protein
MRVERHASAAAFLVSAEPFLLAAEVENNLIHGIAQQLAAGGAAPEIEPYFATARQGDTIRMAAFRTIAIRIGVTRALSDEAVTALVHDAAAACPEAREVVGPEPTAGEFAARLAATHGGTCRRRMAQRIFALRALESLSGLPAGRLRLAEPDDAALLAQWAASFIEDIGEPGDGAEVVQARVSRRQLYVWDDGKPVSMAAWTGKTPNGVRLNLVYTPKALRGRGYATAAVAALSQRLLDAGNQYCCLFTDLANPTSNAIYQRIGYRVVCDAGVYVIE